MIPLLHANLCSRGTLLAARRALYRMAVDFSRPSAPPDDRTLDSPLLRRAVQVAMATGGSVSSGDLDRASRFAAAPTHLASGSARVPLIDAPCADDELLDVRHTLAPDGDVHFLTLRDGARFTTATAALQTGLELAARYSPLPDDLMPHVALVGLLDESRSGGVHSASLREYPGLVMMSAPGSPLEAAEMLLHEAAHQKLFDLILVLDMLDTESDACPTFAPPWRAKGTRWPLEQCLAALHAYRCLASFADDLASALHESEIHERSLLPFSHTRVELLGAWLLEHRDFLGQDAIALVSGVLGIDVPTVAPAEPHRMDDCVVAVASHLEVRTVGDDGPILVGRAGTPHDFYFLGRDSGRVLQLLDGHPRIDCTIAEFARERAVDEIAARRTVEAALRELVDLQLVSVATV